MSKLSRVIKVLYKGHTLTWVYPNRKFTIDPPSEEIKYDVMFAPGLTKVVNNGSPFEFITWAKDKAKVIEGQEHIDEMAKEFEDRVHRKGVID